MRDTEISSPWTGRIIVIAIVLACLAVYLDVIRQVPTLGANEVVVDFDAFYIAGQMLNEGRVGDAYDPLVTISRQSEIAGRFIFMPWAYPPQFDLVAMMLPLLPRGLSYAVFIGLTFLVYSIVVARLAGSRTWFIYLALVPAFMMTIRIGQNGFLSGSLVGLFALLFLARKWTAGVALGLMAFKPHLAVGLGLYALVGRWWKILATAFATVIASSLLATVIMGPEVWPAFLSAPRVVRHYMETGNYPFYRMVSVYSGLTTLGVPKGIALAMQGVVAICSGFIIVIAAISKHEARLTLGTTVMTSLLFSPYAYDYDLPVVGIGLALLAPEIFRHSRYMPVAVLLLAWISGGYGLALNTISEHYSALKSGLAAPMGIPSIGFLGVLGLNLLTSASVLRRFSGASASRSTFGQSPAR